MQAKKDYSFVGFIFSLYILSTIPIQFIVLLFSDVLSTDMLTLLNTVFTHLAGFLLIYFTIAKSSKLNSPIPKVKISFKRFSHLFFISYFLMIVGNIFGLIITSYIGNLKGDGVDNVLIDTLEVLSPFTTFLLVVVIAPIIEELFFRKFIIDKVYNHGAVPAIVISSLMFALFHLNFNQFVYAFLLGLILSYVYVNYGNIKNCILLHMMINSVGFLISLFPADDLLEISNELTTLDPSSVESTELILNNITTIVPLLIIEACIFVFVILGFIFFIKNIKTFKQYASYAKSSQTIKTSQAFLNAGIIVFTLICTVLIVLQLLS